MPFAPSAIPSAVACLLLATGLTTLTAADQISAKPWGLRLVGPTIGEGNDQLRPFNWSQGLSVILLLERPSGGMLGVDEAASKVTAFTDDQGTDLTKQPEGSWSQGVNFETPMDPVSPDGKHMLVELESEALPAASATSLTITGSISVKAATTKDSVEHAGLALKDGQTVSVGPVTFTISEVGKPDWGDKPLQFSLTTTDDLSVLASLQATDAGGADLEMASNGSSSMTSGGKTTTTRSYTLNKQVDSITLTGTWWKDMQTIAMPVDLTVAVGVGE